jgi:hypothetical protein
MGPDSSSPTRTPTATSNATKIIGAKNKPSAIFRCCGGAIREPAHVQATEAETSATANDIALAVLSLFLIVAPSIKATITPVTK